MKIKTCCFAQQKPTTIPFILNENDERCMQLKWLLKQEIEKAYKSGVHHYVSDMAPGVNTYSAEIILELRRIHPEITLECVIPYEAQPEKWKESDRNRYYSIFAECDKESMLQKKYTDSCIEKSSKYLINNSDILIAVFNEEFSDTEETLQYAKSCQKEVVIITPKDFT